MRTLLALLVMCSSAMAHDAIPTKMQPKGWSYPPGCCNLTDCRPVEKVKETSKGYLVPSGELIGYSDKRIKISPDGLYHWCSRQGADTWNGVSYQAGETLCLYVPPRSY